MLETETNKIRDILINNGYPDNLINKEIKLHSDRLKKIKSIGPQKRHVILKLPFMGNKVHIFEKKIKSMTESIYYAITPRIVFVSKPVLKIELKDPIPFMEKSCVVYRYNCFCKRSYIGQTSRHLRTRIKEHVPKCVRDFVEGKNNKKTKALINATRKSAIADHLFNYPNCGNNYEDTRFQIIQQCSNVYDLLKLEAICIYLNKPELCKQKEFDYVVALFN